jgi:predicted Zn-dependent protease
VTIRKSFTYLAYSVALTGVLGAVVAACSVNPATGRNQFTGLMNTAQENQHGSKAQTQVEQTYGVVSDPKITAYINGICAKLQPGLERTDVSYRCTVLDSPVVNAFALPGGYININRGLLAYANSEAEVAGVLAHEMGHVTAKHISERYSQATLTQLGGTLASAALGSGAADQLIGLGSNLYLSSYSRSQETEADDLGIRYLNRGGYDPMAMGSFLSILQRESALQAAEAGKEHTEMRSFMATHPLTSERVARANQVAQASAPKGTNEGVAAHMAAINGLVYGDSPKDGYVKGNEFVHPGMGFAFYAPQAFTVKNSPQQVTAQSRSGSGAAFVFNGAAKPAGLDPATYITQGWVSGQQGLSNVESITVNGMRAATAQIQGSINNKPALMRLVAVEWTPTQVFRFQFAMPQSTTPEEIEIFKKITYSMRRLSEAEKNTATPKRVKVFTASAGDSVAAIASRMPFDDNLNEQRFRTLNGMNAGDAIIPGKQYKTISQ